MKRNKKSDDLWSQKEVVSSQLWDIAQYHDKGQRPTMEDSVQVIEGFIPDSPCSLFLGVFDGHSGCKCSQFVSSELPKEMTKLFGETNDILDVMQQSFMTTDDLWLEQARKEKWEEGSTGLCLILKNNTLYIANTGDCRALLCQGGNVVQLTKDHKPDDPAEKERIIKQGGHVIGGRIEAKIGVSRSFGDYLFKEPDRNLMTCAPETSYQVLNPECEFIVLGCDGLYDEISNEDIIKFVKERLDTKVPVSDVCKEIVKEALERGSTDNISVVIVKFEKKFKKKLLKAQNTKKNPLSQSTDSISNSSSEVTYDSDLDDQKAKKRKVLADIKTFGFRKELLSDVKSITLNNPLKPRPKSVDIDHFDKHKDKDKDKDKDKRASNSSDDQVQDLGLASSSSSSSYQQQQQQQSQHKQDPLEKFLALKDSADAKKGRIHRKSQLSKPSSYKAEEINSPNELSKSLKIERSSPSKKRYSNDSSDDVKTTSSSSTSITTTTFSTTSTTISSPNSMRSSSSPSTTNTTTTSPSLNTSMRHSTPNTSDTSPPPRRKKRSSDLSQSDVEITITSDPPKKKKDKVCNQVD
eukprot:TRINITY_DN6045_c2_g2_i2.p1 TRINITY_DN6045_c2_g2~~TRINITY_DN6045_c2_g2_i2.p1  ORF type:complete len:579 (-),score=180.95 TRINITY_DN6045_c2_g2_i2:103-1839(-)